MNTILNSLKLDLLHAGFVKVNATLNYKNIISPFTRLIYVTKGEALISHTNQTYILKPNHMYLIPSYVYNHYKCDDFFEQYYLSFFEELKLGVSIYDVKEFFYEVEATELEMDYFKRLIEINPTIKIKNSTPKAFEKKGFSKKHKKKSSSFSSNNYLETKGIVTILLSKFIKNTHNVVKQNSIDGDLNKIIIYIAKNLHTDITVDKLATYCSLNADYFSRVFKNKFEIRPHKYIQQKRIEKAQLLLLTTHYSIKEVAFNVGFKDVFHFSKLFKKHSKLSPAKYRKEHVSS
jgi:AraC-like DNA-binding protein